MAKVFTTATIRSDGTVVEVLAGGAERSFPEPSMRPVTETEIAAAGADPDARPMMAEELRKARRVPRIRTLRRALGLTQEEFSGRYHIPLGTLRNWEARALRAGSTGARLSQSDCRRSRGSAACACSQP